MKVIYYVFECLDLEFLEQCNTPNIDSLDPHPAISPARMTRSSVPMLLGGFLPECKKEDCYHNKFRMMTPFFLSRLKESANLYLYIPNGWILEFLSSYLRENIRKEVIHWHKLHNTREMVDNFISHNEDDYFVYFHVMETHPPYYYPPERTVLNLGQNESKERQTEHRIRSIEHADEILGDVIKLNPDLLVVTSDHNLTQGRWSPKDFDVFLATKGNVITKALPELYEEGM